jgi:hypothetical protein
MKTNSTEKKSSRGGARPGAGRKPLGRIKRLISLSPETLAEIQRRATAQRVPIGRVIDALTFPERTTK